MTPTTPPSATNREVAELRPSRTADRPARVVINGIHHLVADSTPRHQARIDDLLMVADALDAAGVPMLLIRRGDGRRTSAIAIDSDHRHRAFGALREALPALGAYVKPQRQPAVPIAQAINPGSDPSSVRIYRPRTNTSGTLRYGPSTGVRLELWHFGDQTVEAPDDNAYLRRSTPVDDLAYTTTVQFGREWRTVEGMFDPHPDDFDEEIDMVFSWVDGSSTAFQRQRAAQMESYVVGEGDDGAARYRHVDELRYALRSVHMYAPWVRRIFIATDSRAPEWLADHPKVTIVRSEEFFADPSTLPTHNSHAVESQLHRIPGLAEHFLYSNDDMFFGREVEPELFFSAGGISKFVETGVRIGAGATTAERSGHDNGLRNNRALLRERFGRTIVRDLAHCATPLRRSVMAELEQTFPTDFARTAASPFRSEADISVTNSLYHYYALITGRAVVTTTPRVHYLHTTLRESLHRMERLSARSNVDMLCLNDGGESEIEEAVRTRVLRDALERVFPIVAPWERPDASEAPESASSGSHAAGSRA